MANEEYDVWLLRWPAGTRVTPHDHGESIAAFSVVSGELVELRWRDSISASRVIGPGETVSIERRVVHDVVAPSCTSYSIHVYSPPLTAMSFYDEFGADVIGEIQIDGAGDMSAWI